MASIYSKLCVMIGKHRILSYTGGDAVPQSIWSGLPCSFILYIYVLKMATEMKMLVMGRAMLLTTRLRLLEDYCLSF